MPPTAASEYLTFLDLAEVVLRSSGKPLSIAEVWQRANAAGLSTKLRSQGKTPEATLGARMYLDAKEPDGRLQRVGEEKPATFVLRGASGGTSSAQPASSVPISDTSSLASPSSKLPISEREMHPALVHFARQMWGARCKTVYHEKSKKGTSKRDEWLHPDIVGFRLLTDGWKDSPREVAAKLGARPVHLYSFELKREIDFAYLRQYFFQAVSNSSWAHEGYLAVWRIEPDPEFREVLARLSRSFGIGVIELRPDSPNDSELLHPARVRDQIDWTMVNTLVDTNEDFRAFIEQVNKSIKINSVFAESFDEPPTEADLTALATKAAPKGGGS